MKLGKRRVEERINRIKGKVKQNEVREKKDAVESLNTEKEKKD